MHAIILIGHGSLKSASGAAMIRIAARLREHGVAPLAEASFLNFSRPTLDETVARCIAQGATALTIQPYFLIAGKYVQEDVTAQVAALAGHYPHLVVRVAPAFGDHPALAQLVLARARAGDPALGWGDGPAALLLLAHGTPFPAANAPIYQVARRVRAMSGYARVEIGYMECNQPDIPTAIDALVRAGMRRIVATPYFLHLGRHTRDDLPALVAQGQQRHPDVSFTLTRHLDYDPQLVDVVADRCREAQGPPAPRRSAKAFEHLRV